MRGAMLVIGKAHDEELPDWVNLCEPNTLTAIAAHLIGFDLDELQEEGSAEGNENRKTQGGG